ncbi:MAG: alpha/beta hydrolase [Deltaproteobacteria bacterium]|nr:MAG: alpha/beta hydrolase [Deltaproteobacteria bacterium]
MRILLALLLAAACTRGEAAAPRRRVALAPCRLKGTGLPAQCGALRVPEDRAHPRGRQIDLKLAVVPALARAPAPDPLFLLAGGPGQSALEALGPLLGAFERLHRTRDLVLVDQRGTGSSHPLRCDLHPPEAPLAEKFASDGLEEERFRKCLQGYDADPRLYTTTIAMEDLDEVREALGYDRIDLWGGSYGTRAALIYLREHAAHARVAILDGVAPLALRLPATFARDGQRSMDLLFKHCAEEKACATAFPDLQRRLTDLLRELQAHPARTHVNDPVNGQPAEVVIHRDVFAFGLRGILYQQDFASLVPLIVDRAARGDFAPFVAATAGLDQGFSRTVSLGLLFSVLCAEDMPFVQPEEIDELSRGTFLGPQLARDFMRICSFWPRGSIPPGFREPVRSDKPVLLLSGELDPVTPPEWAEQARKTLPNSLHLVVPGVGHGASAEGCVPQLMAKLVEQGSLAGIDGNCLRPLRRPPFFVTFAGPSP